MEIKNRVFPYPVLCEDTDDYKDSSFSVTVDTFQGINELSFIFQFSLENGGLQELINKGDAYFAIHFECSKTAYRRLLKTQQLTLKFTISMTRINGDIQLIGAIISNRDIHYYQNAKLNEDYKLNEVFLPRAAFLAYQSLPKIRVNKHYEELQSSESMFCIVKRSLNNGTIEPIDIDLGIDKIKISVNEDIYKSYIKYSLNDNTKGLLWSLLLLPALIHMLDRIRTDSISAYENCDWLIKITQQYKMQGLDFEEVVMDLDKPILQIAQEILQMPIDKAFSDIGMILGSDEG